MNELFKTNEMEILILIIVLICFTIFLILFPFDHTSTLSKVVGGVKTNFFKHPTNEASVRRCIDVITDIALVFPPGYASLCYKFFIKQASPEDVKRLRIALALNPSDNVKVKFDEKLGKDGRDIVSNALRYDAPLVLNWLAAADITTTELEGKRLKNPIFNRAPPKQITFITCLEALICLHYYDKMDLTVIEILGMGAFNAVYLCEDERSKQQYALRINILKTTNYRPDQEVFEEYKQTCSLIRGNPKFPVIYHGSHEYEHLTTANDHSNDRSNWLRHSINASKDKNPDNYDVLVVWALTKRYESIEFEVLPPQLLINYCSSVVDVVNFIHGKDKIFIDWKYRNFLYDSDLQSYIMTDFDLMSATVMDTSFAFTHRFMFTSEVKSNFTVQNRLGPSRQGTITYMDMSNDYAKISNRVEINKQIDSLVAMKEIVSFVETFNTYGPSDMFHYEYNGYQKEAWDAKTLLEHYKNIEGRIIFDFTNAGAVNVVKFLQEGEKLLQDCIESGNHLRIEHNPVLMKPIAAPDPDVAKRLNADITMEDLKKMKEVEVKELARCYRKSKGPTDAKKMAQFVVEARIFIKNPANEPIIMNITKGNKFTMNFLFEELVKNGNLNAHR